MIALNMSFSFWRKYYYVHVHGGIQRILWTGINLLFSMANKVSLTLGAYFTNKRILALWYVLSAAFCVWQMKVVLWCSFLGFMVRIDLAVYNLLSGISSAEYSILPFDESGVTTWPKPSIQVIWKHKMSSINRKVRIYFEFEKL